MPTTERAARCEDVVKTYRLPGSEVRALRGVTAEFARGELSAVVGPSGSGKSTMLRVLSGIDRPDTGRVEVEGRSVASAGSAARRRLRRDVVRFLFQRPSDNFVPYRTVIEHLREASEDGDESRIADALARLGLRARADHLPSELSGGEQQRAALAQALVAGVPFVVADEPTAELDAGSVKDLVDALGLLTGAGITVVVATHDRALARAASHVVELEHGRTKSRQAPDRVPPVASSLAARTRPVTAARGPAAPTSGFVWAPPTERVEARPPLERDVGERSQATAGSILLRVDGVTKTYRRGDEDVHAVSGARLSLARGEIVGLVGRSGSGKTTLLSMLAGWEEADEGSIRWSDPPAAPPAWTDVAVVPQHLGLVEELTLRENVALPLRLGASARASSVDELVEQLGLLDVADRLPPETSVGEQQRAALARALVVSPRLLLADEPTGHQDEASSRRVFDAIALAARAGTCCLLATHDEGVRPYLDRVLEMSDGRVSSASG